MEALFGLALLGSFVWSCFKVLLYVFRFCRHRLVALRTAASRRGAAVLPKQAEDQQANRLARQLQLALLALSQAPDFQRAASWAQHAQRVPVWFRQRIFRRFRPQLVQHTASRLAAGEDAERLVHSLAALVQALGVAAFEAQYIEAEARRRLTTVTRPAAVSFEQQLRESQRLHQERIGALRALTGIDADTKEQLIEAEVNRFRQSLLGLGGAGGP